MLIRSLTAAALAITAGTAAHAGITVYSLDFLGTNEVSNGDPDGYGSGTISFDDVTGEITWSISYFNIDDPTAMHIHGPGGIPGVNAGVFVGLGVAGDTNTDTLFGSTTTTTTNVANIIGDPNSYYVNIHNSAHPGGALRAQVVPEPTSLALLGLGGIMVMARRRRG